MVDDSRYRVKVFLDTSPTGLTAANILKDDDVTLATYWTCYGRPNYSLERVFIDKEVDVVFSVDQADSQAVQGFNQKTAYYDDDCDITISCIQKTGITGPKMINTCAQELRRIYENTPTSAANILRRIGRMSNQPKDLGGYQLYEATYHAHYRRAADQAHTTASISYGMGCIVDGDKTSGGIEGTWTDAGGNTGTFVSLSGDIFHLNVTVQGGAGDYYIKNGDNLGLSTDTYTKIRWRYYTSDTSIKAKIIVGDDGAYSQTVLADSSSTTWTVGSADLTAGKTLDHISLYADHSNGSVYYDYIQIYRGDFTFPNIISLEQSYRGRNVHRGVPFKIGALTQKLGGDSTEYQLECDLSIGTWTTTGYANKDGEVLMDILHEGGIDEPWQWLNLEDDQVKFCLDSLDMPTGEGNTIATLRGHEYRLGTAGSETTTQRFSLDQ